MPVMHSVEPAVQQVMNYTNFQLYQFREVSQPSAAAGSVCERMCVCVYVFAYIFT